MNDNDKAGRYLVKRDPARFLGWLAGQPEAFHAWIDARRLALPDQGDLTHDLIAACRVGAGFEALCLELQAESAANGASRLLYGYVPRLAGEPGGLLLTAIGGVVINLTGPPQPVAVSQRPTLLPACRFDGSVGQLTLRDEPAGSLVAAVAAGRASASLPLLQNADDAGTIAAW